MIYNVWWDAKPYSTQPVHHFDYKRTLSGDVRSTSVSTHQGISAVPASLFGVFHALHVGARRFVPRPFCNPAVRTRRLLKG